MGFVGYCTTILGVAPKLSETKMWESRLALPGKISWRFGCISFTQTNGPQQKQPEKRKATMGPTRFFLFFFPREVGKRWISCCFCVRLISSEGIQLKISVRYIGSYYPSGN